MEDLGYQQANLVKNIVANMSGLPFTYRSQDPAYTPVPNSDPTIVPTFQPVATDSVSNILPQILTSMKKMQKLLILMQTNKTGGGGQTNNHTTLHPPTCQSATEPIQGQPHKPLPDFTNKYWWTHGKCAHKGAACKNKAARHQYSETFFNKHSGITYWCTWQWG